MEYEVEQKFRLSDPAALEARLRELGSASFEEIEQVDSYFAHPSRDFAETDEALRIRRVGDQNFVTYKGPKLDATTKTRREIELPLPGVDAYFRQFRTLLEVLGFQLVADVHKRRRQTTLVWDDAHVEVTMDDVAGVGLYAEIELAADENGLEDAKDRLSTLAAELGLTASERRSYLELLLGV